MNKILINNIYASERSPSLAITKKKVVIIESDFEKQQGITFLIKSSNNYIVTGAFESYEKAFSKLIKNLPDIVVLDIDPEIQSGLDAIEKIKSCFSQVEILVLSSYYDRITVLDALKVGASGFIIKSDNLMTLMNSIDDLASGGAPLSNPIARLLVNEFKTNLNSPLSHRENQIIQMIVRGLPQTEIAQRLGISRETTKTHFRNIYKKLNVNSKAEAIEYALKEKIVQNI